MSNLNLPTLSASNLEAIVAATPHGEARLAYATTAHQVGDGQHIVVMHHTTSIALVSPERVEVQHGGHHSATTAARLDRVLQANGVPLRVALRGGVLRFLDAETLRVVGDFEPTRFERTADGWSTVRGYFPRVQGGRYSILD